jgi:hypothetical protein
MAGGENAIIKYVKAETAEDKTKNTGRGTP